VKQIEKAREENPEGEKDCESGQNIEAAQPSFVCFFQRPQILLP
jgi:hypothetical protein